MSDVARAMQTPVPSGAPTPPTPEPTQPDLGRVRQEKAPRKRKKKAATVAIGRKRSRPARKAVAAKPVRKASRGRKDVTLDLGGAMALLSSMHRTDVPVFQVLSEAISARGKPSRKRLLAALNKVFG